MLPVPSISAGAGTPKNTLAAMFGVKKYPTSRVGVVAFPIRTLEPGRGAPARVMFGAFSSTKTSVAFTVTAHRFSFGESCAEAGVARTALSRNNAPASGKAVGRSEEHTSELQSLMRIS